MKRRPLLLAVVLTIAAVGCIVTTPLGSDLWLAVAYEEEYSGKRIYWDFDFLQDLDGKELVFLRKRSRFLPGKDAIIRDQVCGKCQQESHISVYCMKTFNVRRKFNGAVLVSVEAENPDARCLCPTCHPEKAK